MLCQPNFGDQMVNARYRTDIWRVGLHLIYITLGRLCRIYINTTWFFSSRIT
jgi:hypothetical protein